MEKIKAGWFVRSAFHSQYNFLVKICFPLWKTAKKPDTSLEEEEKSEREKGKKKQSGRKGRVSIKYAHLSERKKDTLL